MRTFVTAQAGQFLHTTNQSGEVSDEAFAELEASVDILAARVKALMKPGGIDVLVGNALKPYEAAIRRKATQIRNSAHRHGPAGSYNGIYKLPKAD